MRAHDELFFQNSFFDAAMSIDDIVKKNAPCETWSEVSIRRGHSECSTSIRICHESSFLQEATELERPATGRAGVRDSATSGPRPTS